MKLKVLAFCLLFTFASTSSWGWISSLSNKGEELVGIFEAIETEGPTAKNVSGLESFVRNNSGEPYADEALLALARIYSANKDYPKATEACQKIALDFPDSRFRYDALYELGNVMYRTGRLSEALSVLAPVFPD